MRKWATGSHHSSSDTSRAWHQTSQTIFFTPSGPANSQCTYKPYLPARLTAVSIQPPTPLTEFARSHPSLPQRASPLRRPTTEPGYWIILRNCHAKLPNCRHLKSTATSCPATNTALTPETTATAPLTTLQHPTTSAGTTGILGMKPENAPNRAPASRRTTASRGTPASRETPTSRY
jgi:hypothetical protein